MHEDQRYITGFRSGDERLVNQLLKEVYSLYEERIVQFVVKNSGNSTDGADIFQRCVMTIYQKAIGKDDFQLTSSIYTYIYSVAKNMWFKELRKKKRGNLLTEKDEKVLSGDDVNLKALIDEDGQIQKDILFNENFRLLSTDCQKLLSAYFEKIAPGKIASMFKVTEGGYRVKKARCVKRLTKLIQNDPRFPGLKK